jgi:small subunit ribosomal protein S1
MASNKTDIPEFLFSEEEDEFAKMFAESGQSARPQLSQGELVKGKIISITHENVFIDLGGKAEGSIDAAELADEKLVVGDMIEAIVVGFTDGIRLSRTLAGASRDAAAIADAFESGLPVEGHLESRNKGGFDVKLGNLRAFMPVSHLALEQIPEEDFENWLGKSYRFLVIEHDPSARRLVVSRTALIRRDREAAAEVLWGTIEVGYKVRGKVSSVQDYGAFVDIGGIDGLLHVREMSWSRVGHPKELVSVGDEIDVTVTEIDRERKRVGLSSKAADADPWNRVGVDINIGDNVDGVVTRLMAYGAFVELISGVEGLVHISEITHLQRVRHPRDIVNVGETVKVTLLDIDPVNRRVSLSMKQVEGDPWENAAENFALGSRISGTVESVAPFGVFIQVAPGVTALLPGSETEQRGQGDLSRFFKPGELVSAVVLSLDPENKRMSLSTRSEGDAEEMADVADYKQKSKARGPGLGTMADLFKGLNLK